MAPIVSATESMEMLVDDLSTLTLAESGALQLHREPIDVAVLVNETLDAFGAEARAAGVQLTEHVDARPSADRRRPRPNPRSSGQSRQQRAGPRTRRRYASASRDVPPTARCCSRSATTEPGIPAELLPRIFDRFVKGPSSTGSGLGLAIVRDVVEAHGGSVAATSTPAEGTAITLTLPAAASPLMWYR